MSNNINTNTPEELIGKVLDYTSNNEKSSIKNKQKNPIKVTSRVVFLRIGQVDTKNERYDAELYLEASWEDDKIFQILANPNMPKNGKF